jgi:hypothetical protein
MNDMSKTLVIAVVLGTAGWWYWGRTLEPVRVIRAQLEAIEKGDMSQAYGYLTPEAQRSIPITAFEARARGHSGVAKAYDSTFLTRHIEQNVATISGTVDGYDGQVSNVSYVLIKEEGGWKIQSFNWSPPRGKKEPLLQ